MSSSNYSLDQMKGVLVEGIADGLRAIENRIRHIKFTDEQLMKMKEQVIHLATVIEGKMHPL